MKKRVLLADDDAELRDTMAQTVIGLGHDAVTVVDAIDAIAALESQPIDFCITDLQLPGADAHAVLAAARRRSPPVPVVVLTSSGTIREAVAAVNAGAIDVIGKPVSPGVVSRLLQEHLSLPEPGPALRATNGAALVGEHAAIRLVLERIEQVADTDANVLIRGETGTGKEVVARLIHAASSRRSGPFVAVNMAAIPEALAESEILGHTRGAFTGAERSRPGKVLAAQGGTLFLDEIGDMPRGLQAKLLRVLQEREVQPVGGSAPVSVDVRVIAATHRNLEQMVRDGTFREDLFYRLYVIPIELPPLRDRKEDLPLLAEHFRNEMNARNGRTVPAFGSEVVERLMTYDWPGNVRQLQNVIERMVVVAGSRAVTVGDLPANLRSSSLDLATARLDLPPSGVDLRGLLSQLEDRLIGQALKRTGGNKNRAAELLGLNRTTLVEKLRRRNVA